MPSDAKKREQQRKKDARNKKIASVSSSKKIPDAKQNGVNGTAVEMTEEGENFNRMWRKIA